MKERKLNNKGFSLVELIIVIAIMVILVVVIAPQYLKFVNNSKVSADVQTAQAIETAVDAAIANNQKAFSAENTIDWDKVDGISSNPLSKFGGTFKVYGKNETGVSKITLDYNSKEYECFPNPERDEEGKAKGINLDTDKGGLRQK